MSNTIDPQMDQRTDDLPTNYRDGEIVIEDGSSPPKFIVFKKTEGNFQCTPGDVEEIDVIVRGEVDSVLDGKNGPTTFSWSGYFDGCMNHENREEPRAYELIGTGEMPEGWVKADVRISRPNFNVRFRKYYPDGETLKSELLFPGSTLKGGVKEGQIDELNLSGRCPRYAFPKIIK